MQCVCAIDHDDPEGIKVELLQKWCNVLEKNLNIQDTTFEVPQIEDETDGIQGDAHEENARKYLKFLFDRMDSNKDGCLSQDELRCFLQKLHDDVEVRCGNKKADNVLKVVAHNNTFFFFFHLDKFITTGRYTS